jgi:hypothetical protein
MKLKERIQDIFDRYSVNLNVDEKDEEKSMDHTPDHKDEEVALAEKKLANGTIIYTDAEAFAEGVDVFIVNEEGERMPLPDGEYEYEEGGKTVVAEGKIVSIMEDEEEEKEMEEEEEKEMEDEEKEEMSDDTFTVDQVKSMIADAVAEAKNEFSKVLKEQGKELETVKAQLSKTSAEKGLAKTRKSTVKRKDLRNLSKADRVAAIHEMYSIK